MYQLIFYVPASHLEEVKAALFAAGAGRFDAYDQCAWQILGEGQFRPLAGSRPFIGETGRLETVSEYKVELVCEDHLIKPAVSALLRAHPYQQPAYAVYKILTIDDLP